MDQVASDSKNQSPLAKLKLEQEAAIVVLSALEGLDEAARARVIATAAAHLGIASPSPPNSGAIGQRQSVASGLPETPEDFIIRKAPRAMTERVACLGAYLLRNRGQAEFKTEDITALNDEANQPRFTNATQACKDAVKAQLLVPTFEGRRKLTSRGKALVDALPDRTAVDAALSSIPLSGRRRFKSDNQAVDDEPSEDESPKKNGRRRAAMARAVEHSSRTAGLSAVDPEEVAEWSERISLAPKKLVAHGILLFARKHGVPNLTIAEMRAIMANVLGIGIPEGTWTSYLSTAPVTEIYKVAQPDGRTAYQVLRAGEAAWANASPT